MIDKFIAEVRTRGLARTNRYEVQIPFPGGAWGTDIEVGQLTSLLCESVSIPGLNIATQPHLTYGESREMPYNRNFEPVQMTFYVDAGMQVKTAFDRWLATIIHPQTRTVNYYENYAKDILIHVITVDEQRAMSIKLFEAYPKTISAIQMSQESKDIMKLQVTFQFKNWLTENYNAAGRMSPPPFLSPSNPAFQDNSSSGIEGSDPPVTEEEIIDVEDRENY